jgi:hypothetical protein
MGWSAKDQGSQHGSASETVARITILSQAIRPAPVAGQGRQRKSSGRMPLWVTKGGCGGHCRFLLFDLEAVVQGRTSILQEARLASPYPECAASIPSAVIRIPWACSWRTGRPPQPCRIAYSRGRRPFTKGLLFARGRDRRRGVRGAQARHSLRHLPERWGSVPELRSRAKSQSAAVTRQIRLPTSSATSSAPCRSKTTPTGRPSASPAALRNPVSTSTGSPAGRPSSKGTKITL